MLKALETQKPSKSLQKIISAAQDLGVPEGSLVFTPTLARGLDYYTGMIFEGVIPEYSVGSVGGGGRYNNLFNELVGVDQPAVGFGLGFDRTLEAAEELGVLTIELTAVQVLVTVMDESTQEASLYTARTLRENGIAVDVYPGVAKLQKQLKYADKKNIPYVMVIGTDEVASNTVVLKDMKTGDQQTLPLKEAIAKL